MKRFIRTVAIILLCGAMAIPSLDAQSRGRGRYNGGGTHQPANTPHNNGNGGQRPGNNGGQRPGNNGGQRPGNNGGQRPGNNGGQRPGNNGNNRPGHNGNNRPGHNGNNRPDHNDYNRPGHNGGNHGGNHGGNRPGHNGNHNRPVNPGYRPGGPSMGHHHGNHRPSYRPNHGPMRPGTPPPRPFYRPAPPPPGWRPSPHWHPINTIFGITIGTAFNITLNALINNGYNINSYGNDVITLNNVQMLNMYWPSATLYFNNGNRLYASQFVYPTNYYDTSRYDMAYTMLTRNYGSPVSVNNTGNGVETTWWGSGNQFIHLSYVSDYSAAGYPSYYTILSFGN